MDEAGNDDGAVVDNDAREHEAMPSGLLVPGVWRVKTALNAAGIIDDCAFFINDRDAVKWRIGRREEYVSDDCRERLCVRLCCLDTKAVSEMVVSLQALPEGVEKSAAMVDRVVHMHSQWPERGHLIVRLNKETWLPVDLPLEGSVELTPHLTSGHNDLSFVQLKAIDNKMFVACAHMYTPETPAEPSLSANMDMMSPDIAVDPTLDFTGHVYL